MPPVFWQAGSGACRRRQGAVGLGENGFLIIGVRIQWIAMVQPRLETRIGLSRVMQKARELQIHNTLGREAGGFSQAIGLLFHITAMLLKGQGKPATEPLVSSSVVLGRPSSSSFCL